MAGFPNQRAGGETLKPAGILEGGKLRNKHPDLLSSTGVPTGQTPKPEVKGAHCSVYGCQCAEAGWIRVERDMEGPQKRVRSHPSDQNL